jgi:hypothetical protein|tara:strand:- start:2765 stop:3394 length:630 start_codon:yes stop_codon:yes gene_type:complete
MLDKNLRCNLRAIRAAASLLLITALFSCEREPFTTPCIGGECDAYIQSSFNKDSNGYYHAVLDWTSDYYPYFSLDIYANKTSEDYWYNGLSIVRAEFDTDSYFVLQDSVAFTISLYQPWLGLWNYNGVPIPYENTTIYLDQFEGTIVPVVQSTEILFWENDNGDFTTKRVVGPFPPSMIGDTISIFMKVKWDLGENLIKDGYIEKFIIE